MPPAIVAFWDLATTLLVFVVGLPLLSVVLMLIFAATADFRFVEAKVRGGTLRGAVASALVRVIVRDADNFQLPLVIVLEKTGIFGRRTPLLGGATVRHVEWRIYLDDVHVSTVTEARSTQIEGFRERIELPVNAEIHLPRGLLATLREYRRRKRAGAEVKLAVRGHVVVRHWWMDREVPVRLVRHVVMGDPVPHVRRVRWRAATPSGDVAPAVPDALRTGWAYARLSLRLSNRYRDELLEGALRVELRATRRLLKDRLVGSHEIGTIRIRPGRRRTLRFLVALERVPSGATPPPPGAEVVSIPLEEVEAAAEGAGLQVVTIAARFLWNGDRLDPEDVIVSGVDLGTAAPLLVPVVPRGERAKHRLAARLEKLNVRGAE